MVDYGFEKWKYENQANLAKYNAECNLILEEFKVAVSAGENSLKSVLWINGGASVALLAFISSVWDKSTNDMDINKLLISMIIFVAGTLLSGVAASFHYLGHNAKNETKKQKIYSWCCDGFVFLAYVCFVVAAVFALFAFWVRFTGNTDAQVVNDNVRLFLDGLKTK